MDKIWDFFENNYIVYDTVEEITVVEGYETTLYQGQARELPMEITTTNERVIAKPNIGAIAGTLLVIILTTYIVRWFFALIHT